MSASIIRRSAGQEEVLLSDVMLRGGNSYCIEGSRYGQLNHIGKLLEDENEDAITKAEQELEEIRTLLQSGDDSSAHTGLCNIARRLRLLYGKKAGMSIEAPPAGGFCVTLHLPFQEESEERIHAQNHHC